MTVAPCVRCEHGADQHLLQGVGVSGEPTTASVETVDQISGDSDVRTLVGTFRCAVEGCACPDYVDEPPAKKKAARA